MLSLLHNIVLPLISFLSGIISLYIDPKTDKAKSWIVIAVLVISAGATSLSGEMDDRDKEKAAEEAKSQIVKLTDISQNLARDVGDVKAGVSRVVASLTVWGASDTVVRIQQAVLANQEREKVLPVEASANAQKQAPLIEYFPKNVDGETVTKALKEGGFGFTRIGAKNDLATNAVWVGDSVTVKDIQFVALTLIRAGVQLRAIRRFRENGATSKAHLVEIGSDPAILDMPVLTVADVLNMKDVPPRDNS